jgi:hypothetical protein
MAPGRLPGGGRFTLALFGGTEVSVSSGVIDAPGTVEVADSALLTLFGTGFEVDTGSGFQSVGSGALAALTGLLRGTLDSGDPFEFTLFQGGGGFTGQILLVPEASSTLLLLAGLAGLGARRAREFPRDRS